MHTAPGILEVLITAFDSPRDPIVAAWGRQVPVLLHQRLAAAPGLRPRLALELDRPPNPLRPSEVLLEGQVRGGEQVTLSIRLSRGAGSHPILVREQTFRSRDLFARLDELAADVARALGARLPPRGANAPATSFMALRDYIRAIDLSEEPDLPLELEDRRRKLEWLLLAVEADPSFVPACDALIEAGLKAHQCGLVSEARKALELLSRLQPRDPRASFVLGELALIYGSVDEAAAHFKRCLSRDSNHPRASLRLGMIADEEGDREGAKEHFRTAGAGPEGSVEALMLLGILCAEDGEADAASAAWRKAAEIDPNGEAGIAARLELERGPAAETRKKRRLKPSRKKYFG